MSKLEGCYYLPTFYVCVLLLSAVLPWRRSVCAGPPSAAAERVLEEPRLRGE